MREHHRANMHLFRLIGTKLELLCYIHTEFDPLCIMFDTYDDNIIHSVEQKVSRKGEVTVEWRTYEVSQQNKLQRIAVISVPLPTHTSCVKFSPNQELLLLCCIDGTIIMYDPTKALTTSTRAAFIPTLAAWHSDSMIFVVGNDRGQLQHFNIALQSIKSQTFGDEATPTNILDFSPYFRNQPALIHMEWNKKNDSSYISFYNSGNSLFLLLFERGPIGVLKIIESHNLTGDELVRRYLSGCQVKQATCLLLSMNWDTHPRACMHSLNQILNYLFKLPLTTNHDDLIQNALGSFHVPAGPISRAVEEEYGNEVRDLTRRYFHRLLRYRMFEKAFRLAIDLNDHDLFMDIHFSAMALDNMELASAAKERAETILSRSNSCRSLHSLCSRASCSLCSDSSNEKGEEAEETCSEESRDSQKKEDAKLRQSRKYNYKRTSSTQIPPLPIIHPLCIENTISVSYNDIASSNKTDGLLPPSFNSSNDGILTTTSFNYSSPIPISNPFLASTSFNKPLYKTHFNFTPINTANATNKSSASNNASDDLMTTNFSSFPLTESEVTADNRTVENFSETSCDKSLLNEISYSFNDAPNMITTCMQGDSLISTSFNKPVYKPEDTQPNYPASSSNTIDNIMSTSFSIRVPSTSISYNNSFNILTNTKSETAPSVSRNVKSVSEISDNLPSRSLTDAVTTNKSFIVYSTCNNLMSTSFNYPEGDATSVNNDTNAFNSNQAAKLQRPPVEKKERGLNILPSSTLSSLTSSHANHFHYLRNKGYPLSKSTPGLTDIDEPVLEFPLYKATHVPPCISQRQDSTSNISQSHKASLPSRTYSYNYDLDYLLFHYGTRDDIGLQQRSQTAAGRKFDPSPNFQSNCNVQYRFLESKHLLRSSQSNTSINMNKETKVSCNVPPLPVISTSTTNSKICSTCSPYGNAPISFNEKPKVKFSDTVTHILVPPGTREVHRQKQPTGQIQPTDIKRESSESLPLNMSNEAYLKDSSPLSKDADEKVKEPLKCDDSTKIKVVHFGLL